MRERNSKLFSHGCTIFTASYGNTILFGNNEEFVTWKDFRWFLHFYPASSLGYGYLAFIHGNGWGILGGVNDHGLAFDGNALPLLSLNPHPEKTPRNAFAFKTRMLRELSRVSEVIDMFKEVDWGTLASQYHIADATGDAVVISCGIDGELAFTRKEQGDGYLVSTNFNRANPKSVTVTSTYPCPRYDTAVAMLEKIRREDDLTVEYCRSILTAVHKESASTNTIYSNICDLKNGCVYLYYFHRFNEVVKLNLAQEFAKGERKIQTRDLFSQETVAAALAEYQRYKETAAVTSEKLIA